MKLKIFLLLLLLSGLFPVARGQRTPVRRPAYACALSGMFSPRLVQTQGDSTSVSFVVQNAFSYSLSSRSRLVAPDGKHYPLRHARLYSRYKTAWEQVRGQDYAGLIGLDADFDGNIIGKGFPEGLTETTLGGYYAAGGAGDKKLIYRTDVVNSVPPYPVFPGEKYVGLVYKYTLIDQQYQLSVFS